ncbi:hypothetical protein B0T17DRAFT_410568 [Bombardia bombarda]|uniref:Protein kinase domain-containing protein n=1 Tax=Bombardia bombarda TaxID=252184 RepID=A0AA39TU56_9PEZI|nr:hypothetical protein B0T17DRAFT_410568 [Bombardia bombarda]
MWWSIIGMGGFAFVSCTDEKTVLKGHQVWEDGKIRASFEESCEEELSKEAHIYKLLGEHPQILKFFRLEEVHTGRSFEARPRIKRELFALGSGLYEIVAWARLFPGSNEDDIQERLSDEVFPSLEDLPIRNVIHGCWNELYDNAVCSGTVVIIGLSTSRGCLG